MPAKLTLRLEYISHASVHRISSTLPRTTPRVADHRDAFVDNTPENIGSRTSENAATRLVQHFADQPWNFRKIPRPSPS